MRFIWFRVVVGLGLAIAVVAHCVGLIPYLCGHLPGLTVA